MSPSVLKVGFALVLCLGPVFAVPADAQAFKRLSVADAQDRCIARTERYASSGLGPDVREPSAYEIRAKYLRCFYGYTGQNPQSVPEFDTSNWSFGLFRKANR